MKDVASKKQVLVTTHNPQMVKFAGQENILLISRDKDGFSVISKPYEKEMVREFLKNEIGIEDLFIQNLL
jgi:predicted ATPase